jgi:uncharacterized protein involved in type VI secretion and phage assembly
MGKMSGVVTGQVIDNVDPDGQGRVQVSFPFLGGQNNSYWAPIATLMSGGGRGAWFMPEVGDEVLVSFNQEDVSSPYIIGFLWNGKDTPPSTDTHLRTIQSVNGHAIQIYDPPVSGGDQGYIRIQYARGDGTMNKVEINNTTIVIQSDSAVSIQAPTVTINGRPVSISANPI